MALSKNSIKALAGSLNVLHSIAISTIAPKRSLFIVVLGALQNPTHYGYLAPLL